MIGEKVKPEKKPEKHYCDICKGHIKDDYATDCPLCDATWCSKCKRWFSPEFDKCPTCGKPEFQICEVQDDELALVEYAILMLHDAMDYQLPSVSKAVIALEKAREKMKA